MTEVPLEIPQEMLQYLGKPSELSAMSTGQIQGSDLTGAVAGQRGGPSLHCVVPVWGPAPTFLVFAMPTTYW